MIALCTFAIGILNFAVIVCSTILAKRMPNPMSDNPAMAIDLNQLGGNQVGETELAGMATISPKKQY